MEENVVTMDLQRVDDSTSRLILEGGTETIVQVATWFAATMLGHALGDDEEGDGIVS